MPRSAQQQQQQQQCGESYATTFTILCGTTMTFLGALPSSARRTASNSSTARSISALTASRETVTSARFFPLICTGSVIVSSTKRSCSTDGQGASATRPPFPSADQH